MWEGVLLAWISRGSVDFRIYYYHVRSHWVKHKEEEKRSRGDSSEDDHGDEAEGASLGGDELRSERYKI